MKSAAGKLKKTAGKSGKTGNKAGQRLELARETRGDGEGIAYKQRRAGIKEGKTLRQEIERFASRDGNCFQLTLLCNKNSFIKGEQCN